MTFVYLQKETNLIKLDQLDLSLNHKIFVKTVFNKKKHQMELRLCIMFLRKLFEISLNTINQPNQTEYMNIILQTCIP